MATITIELRAPSVVSERGKELRQRVRAFFTRALDVLSLCHMDHKYQTIARGEKEDYEASEELGTNLLTIDAYVAQKDPFLWTRGRV